MNRFSTCIAAAFLAAAFSPRIRAEEDVVLTSPGFAPSRVDPEGMLHEDWGQAGLRLVGPEGTSATFEQRREDAPFPHVVTIARVGPVSLTQTAYRAPIWPTGADVVEAQLANAASDRAAVARVEVAIPETVSAGDDLAMLGGRAVLALPPGLTPIRRERAWGCTGGVVPLPGWARPEGACDPAFRNIRAGMGGVPIIYRFSVPPGAARTLLLGFCESHWEAPGQRPLLVHVEGAASQEIDPIARWGRHRPGALRFDARDASGDGRLELVVAPHPQAEDKNTILNAIWIFEPSLHTPESEVIGGRLNAAAERYVDVGGDADQLLYEPGALRYEIELAPGGSRDLLFLVASPGCPGVPALRSSSWTSASLRRAAAEVHAAWPPASVAPAP